MFVYLYYSIVLGSLFLILIERIFIVRIFQHVINFFLIFLILLVPFRSNGVDYDGYVNDYKRVEKSIFDFTYAPIVDLFNWLGIPYSLFLLLQILLFLFVLYKFCLFYRIDFTLVLFLYVLHFFVIRDLSQSRIAFAFTFYLLNELSVKWKYKLFYCFISIGIHLSIFPLFIIRYWIIFLKGKKKGNLFHFISFLILLFLGTYLIESFYFLDPRIEIYLNWKEPGYGDKLSNFFFLYFLSFILVINLILRYLKFDKLFLLENDLILLFMYGIVIGISFSSFAIFSTRLTSIFATYYLFIISRWANVIYINYTVKKRASSLLNLILILIFVILLLRGDNFEIINSVVY